MTDTQDDKKIFKLVTNKVKKALGFKELPEMTVDIHTVMKSLIETPLFRSFVQANDPKEYPRFRWLTNADCNGKITSFTFTLLKDDQD